MVLLALVCRIRKCVMTVEREVGGLLHHFLSPIPAKYPPGPDCQQSFSKKVSWLPKIGKNS